MLLVASLLVVGTIFYVLVEGWGVVDALYFCAMSLATVGYGDVVPETEIGKLFTVVYVLSGIGILVSFFTALTSKTLAAASAAATAVRRDLDHPDRTVGDGRGAALGRRGQLVDWSPAGWWRCACVSATSCSASSWPSARACSSAPSRTSSWRRRSTRRRAAAAWRWG